MARHHLDKVGTRLDRRKNDEDISERIVGGIRIGRGAIRAHAHDHGPNAPHKSKPQKDSKKD